MVAHNVFDMTGLTPCEDCGAQWERIPKNQGSGASRRHAKTCRILRRAERDLGIVQPTNGGTLIEAVKP